MTNESPVVTTAHFTPIITTVGLQRLMLAIQSDAAICLTTVVLGDVGWEPTAQATTLQQECDRVAMTGSRQISDTQHHVTFIVQSDKEYWIREMGLLLDDGTLFAVWSDPQQALAWKAANTQLILGYDIVLAELQSQHIIIEATNSLNLAPGTPLQRGVLRLATQDEANALSAVDVALAPATLPQASDTQQGITRFATPAEAQAGESHTVAMTPVTVRLLNDAHYAQQSGDYVALRARATTKADVGLSNVPNYTATSAIDDNADTKFATARAVKQVNDQAQNKRIVFGPRQFMRTIHQDLSDSMCTEHTANAPEGCVVIAVKHSTYYATGDGQSHRNNVFVGIYYQQLTLE